MTIDQQLLEQKINHGLNNIKPFPGIVHEAISLIDSDTTDNRELARLIKQDPILSARILSIANSPFYGMSREIGEIESASVILGNNIIKNLLISAGAFESFPATEQRKKIWAHSISVASVSEYIANALHQSQSKAYISGLLHDVGKFILLDTFPEYQSIIESHDSLEYENAIEEEMKLIGISHAFLGARIIKQWNLPADIQNIVEMHHEPKKSDDTTACCLLSLADELCHKLLLDFSTDELLAGLGKENIEILNIDTEKVKSYLPDIKKKIDSTAHILEQIK